MQQWAPDLVVPYVLAIVELDDQRDVRLMTRMVDCQPEEIAVGMAVEVTFRAVEDLWLPLFRPSVTSSATVSAGSEKTEVA